jgi:hypothetical protein
MGMKIVWGRSIGFNMSLNGMEKFSPDTWSPMKIETIITDGADCYPWREVFAWWPVKTVTGKRVWWRKIYKRKVWVVWGTGFHMEPHVQFADVFEILRADDELLGQGY